CFLYCWFLHKCNRTLSYKMPAWSKIRDGNERNGKARGIMYLGNSSQYANQEIWLNNDDIRKHILYLGTNGAGKTEGLKSIVSNALT
ncbi:hypothetical protein NL513_28970, partial [Klebsiella pneumoniae]|nr:hypothetical protein [Klebsiella pneumoniae]